MLSLVEIICLSIGGFHARKGSIIGVGISNANVMIAPIIDSLCVCPPMTVSLTSVVPTLGLTMTNHHTRRFLPPSDLAVTDCKKIPVKVCGDRRCSVRRGKQVCREEVSWREREVNILTERMQVVEGVTEMPVETCALHPARLCRNTTQMVPVLTPVSGCAELPRKICSFGFAGQSKSEKPVVTKWCQADSDPGTDQNPRLPPVRVSRLSKSYLTPLRERERRGREIGRIPGM